MDATRSMVKRIGLLWVAAVPCLVLFAHELRPEYLPIEALTASVWAALLGVGGYLAIRLARWGHTRSAVVLLGVAALVACDAAVVVDSALSYDGFGYWTLNGGVGLPYSYAALWYPASLLPSSWDIFGVDQTAITAGDLEWQTEHIAPVAVVLTIASAVLVATLVRALSGGRQVSPALRPGQADA
ncbi:hypothetical protein [Micromonospora tarensis]|uniref:Uncharacterized protein n=1 Tax=Micromonospora tarensis TaxID=2806100 RepID=A0ABS1YHU0_9ACTN|nr:hypothetical protein [Micromonospora tarensis]MBM0276736.1 hypothetical protein [Micromonospora tarensis]